MIGYTVFLTSEENRIVILFTTWPPCWEGAKGLFGFYVKKKKSFAIKSGHTRRSLAEILSRPVPLDTLKSGKIKRPT